MNGAQLPMVHSYSSGLMNGPPAEGGAPGVFLFHGGDGFGDAVDGLQLGIAAGAVAVDQDGEDDGLAAGGGQIAGEGVGLVVRSGFGPELAAQGGVLEAVGDGAVHTGNGQGGAQGRAPGLARGEDQQLREGAGSDAVVGTHAGAVIEEEVVVVHAGIDEELANDARAFGKLPSVP